MRYAGTAASGRTGHRLALPRHIAALRLLVAQNPFAAEVVATFLPCNLGLLLSFPVVLPRRCQPSLSAGSTVLTLPAPEPPLLASTGDFIGCLLTELEINMIILHSNWQHVW